MIILFATTRSQCSLREQPSSVSDNLIARASCVSGIAQFKPPRLQATAFSFYKKASHGDAPAGLVRTQTGPVAVFNRGGGRQI